MSAHRPPRHDDGAGAATDPAFWAQNGNGAAEAGAPRPVPPVLPKMGVRARIADWPPKREPAAASPSREGGREAAAAAATPRGGPGGQQPPLGGGGGGGGGGGVSGLKALHRLARRRSKDVEFQEGWPRACGRPLVPLRHRSSSEVTLSECDPEEAAEARGAKLAGAGGLFREYGSTSSIDVQGISEQSFFAMLNEFRSGGKSSGGVTVSSETPPGPSPVAPRDEPAAQPKEKTRRKGPKGDAGGESIFRKLRSGRNEGDGGGGEEGRAAEPGKAWVCRRSFAHYDVQSMLFDLNAVAANRAVVAQRRNTTTGASAASAASARPGGPDPALASTEDLNGKENLEHDVGDNTSNELLLSCPHFRNEIGGGGERNVSFSRASGGSAGGGPVGDGGFPEPSLDARPTNAGISVLEVPKELQRNPNRLKHYSVEHVDLGARYYRDHFHGKEHSNYFGVDEKLGPVAVSIKREKLEDHKEHGPQYQYRIIFRTSELTTLRGSILEDATPTATKHGTVRGLPLKDALEYVVPELNIHCLRLAMSTPKVTEQLLKLDEQGLCRRHKVGILYCKAGQSSEEEMYNNEDAGPAFEEFLSLLGEKVCLKAFSKYAAQLDTKTDSTGTHSLYTTYQDYEIMFHVSTMLPYTPNNRQQLLRKRHIGNDIVTIIFQEPGALPFTPQNVRSHFQHVFIIVRAHSPCTDNRGRDQVQRRAPLRPPHPQRRHLPQVRRLPRLLAGQGDQRGERRPQVGQIPHHGHPHAAGVPQGPGRELRHQHAHRFGREVQPHLLGLQKKGEDQSPGGRRAAQRRGHRLARLRSGFRPRGRDLLRLGHLQRVRGAARPGRQGGGLQLLLRGRHRLDRRRLHPQDLLRPRRPHLHPGGRGRPRGRQGDRAEVEGDDGGLRDGGHDLEAQRAGPAGFPRQIRRHGGRGGGLRLRLAGRAAAGQPPGGDLQGGRGDPQPRADDRPPAHLRHRQGGHRPAPRGRGAAQGLGRIGGAEQLRTQRRSRQRATPLPQQLGVAVERPRVPQRPPPGHRWPRATPRWQQGHQTAPGVLPRGAAPARQEVRTRDFWGGGKLWGFWGAFWGCRDPPFSPRPDTPDPSASPKAPTPMPRRRSEPRGRSLTGNPRGASRRLPPPPTLAINPLRKGTRPRSGRCCPLSPTVATMSPPAVIRPRGGSAATRAPWRGTNPSRCGTCPPRPGWGASGPAGRRPRARTRPAGTQSPKPPTPATRAATPSPATPPAAATTSAGGGGGGGGGGASSDSGIDAPLYAPKSSRPAAPPQREKIPKGYGEEEPPPAKGYQRPRGCLPPPPAASPDPFKQASSRGGPKGPAEPPRPPGSFQLSASVPKSFFSKQPGRTKPGWKRGDDPPARPTAFPDPKKQVDAGTKNVFGQPRLRASLRDLRSPRKPYKSTVEADLKKLILMDSAGPEPERDTSPPKGLQRTLSDESLCGGRREGAAAPDPPSAATFPSCTLPGRRQHPGSLPEKKCTISSLELRRVEPGPGLMPLPAAGPGLEWASLVSAAKAYEVQRAVSLFSLADPEPQNAPAERPAPRCSEEPPLDLPGKVFQLEAMLKQLHSDLQKEKQDKVVLQAEVASLRQNNQRLQEESQTASEQLRRFARFFGAVDKKEL